jgi:hypothetical protein
MWINHAMDGIIGGAQGFAQFARFNQPAGI